MARLKLGITLAVAAAALGLAGCTVHKQDTPSLSGPSELGISVTVTVSPDVLTQDGASQSLVTILVKDAAGQPVRNVSLRAEISVNGAITDFGSLSARNVVSDTNGRATLVYTAPPAPAINVDSGTIVTIEVTPSGTNFGNEVAQHNATIRLTPPGVVGAPPSSLKPDFSTLSATVGDAAIFSATVVDATGADATPQVVSYVWNFGDGQGGVSRTTTHTYSASGSFSASLTITDNLGRQAFVSHIVAVSPGANPIASFVTSPLAPNTAQSISFNASASTAAPGHTITSYSWDFGDGSSGSNVTTSHAYSTAGTYSVVLTVKDDAGRKGVSSNVISVGSGGPSAVFTFAPTSPTTGQQVAFDASQSRAATGRTIVSYSWNFDDGSTGAGVQPTHTYNAAGTYNVLLTITDDQGQTASTTRSVPVGNGSPTADFNFSPTQPIALQPVFFDATTSSAAPGRSIVSYAWTFGDGTGLPAGPSATTFHPYANAGTYIVRLTVTDSQGLTGTTTRTVVVASDTPTAAFTFAPAAPTVASGVNFDATSSTAAPGRTIQTYAWNFGNGTVGSGATPPTKFYAAGTYTVVLTVTDNLGRTNTTTRSVTVAP
jgi:PKD repeat protein